MRLGNDHDFATCIAKFGPKRYEVVAGEVPSTPIGELWKATAS